MAKQHLCLTLLTKHLNKQKESFFPSCNFCFSQFHNLSFIKSNSCESQHLQQLTQHFHLQHSPMENSNIDSEVWFQNQNQNHCLKFHSSCFPPTSQSALYGSSSMSNTEINTGDEDDVCESYKMRETTKKRKLTPIQLCLLEESFEEDKRLEPDRKLWLAEKLGLQPTQVAVWFQNRRARFKTRQLELDCDSLKASYAKLKTDRDILFRQNQALENKVALLKEELKIQEKLETQSMEAEKLGEEGSSMKSHNTQYTEEEEEEEEEEGLGSNQYSFPELAALGFYYDPTLSASNLGL